MLGLFPTLGSFTGESVIVLLTFLADLKNTFGNWGKCETNAIWDLAYLLSDGSKEVYEAYTAIRMSSNAHIYHETWPMVINALIKRFFTKKSAPGSI